MSAKELQRDLKCLKFRPPSSSRPDFCFAVLCKTFVLLHYNGTRFEHRQ